ncbi:chromate efflux transporter [Halomonas sp. DN3]|uniref:chromate efflux transporter n=1 Tax=Halomonas sp. DN3 TaxID=2953657 RepID=UPI00209F5C93|nr:chromate efflux transporter [Halomonas sp. DN3]USZ50552.1 chromate efflux transporter [Halomonas sp. DN3]
MEHSPQQSQQPLRQQPRRHLDIFLTFLGLGLTSFGGPVAHLGYFHQVFVKRRAWLSESAYAELVALCQFLPGPASSQVGLAIGLIRGGLVGALLAWLAFTLPSALAMMAFAYGAGAMDGALGEALIHSLKLVAVVVVAQALTGMARSLCPDLPRAGMALVALAIMLVVGGIGAQVAVIVLGALAGLLLLEGATSTSNDDAGVPAPSLASWASPVALVLFALLLGGLPLLHWLSPNAWTTLADGFYRAGALVFGGGHVVLPLLDAEVVGRGLVSIQEFTAGYGAAQAVPGPLFTFAAYLGSVAGGVWAGALALVAIFLPGALLVIGLLPAWQRLGRRPRLRAAMSGANAAVVGLLGAAFIDPVWQSAIVSTLDVAIVVAGFVLLKRLPVWALVLAFLALGLVRGLLG